MTQFKLSTHFLADAHNIVNIQLHVRRGTCDVARGHGTLHGAGSEEV